MRPSYAANSYSFSNHNLNLFFASTIAKACNLHPIPMHRHDLSLVNLFFFMMWVTILQGGEQSLISPSLDSNTPLLPHSCKHLNKMLGPVYYLHYFEPNWKPAHRTDFALLKFLWCDSNRHQDPQRKQHLFTTTKLHCQICFCLLHHLEQGYISMQNTFVRKLM